MSLLQRGFGGFLAHLQASVLALVFAFGLTGILAMPTDAMAEDVDRAAIEEIVKDYLLKNPEVIADALAELDRREKAAAEAARLAAVSDSAGILFNSTRQVVLGNPKGSITVVEFFDYNCGYCKRAYGDMVRLIEEEPELRMVLKEFPVLGQSSVEAARVAIAVNSVAPDKYGEFHETLLMQRGQANGDSAMKAAIAAGVDHKEVAKAMTSDEASQTIEEVYSLANRLGLTGTPSYVVGDEVVMGAVGYDQLKAKVTALKTCGETTC